MPGSNQSRAHVKIDNALNRRYAAHAALLVDQLTVQNDLNAEKNFSTWRSTNEESFRRSAAVVAYVTRSSATTTRRRMSSSP